MTVLQVKIIVSVIKLKDLGLFGEFGDLPSFLIFDLRLIFEGDKMVEVEGRGFESAERRENVLC